jgi:hypothetical protein
MRKSGTRELLSAVAPRADSADASRQLTSLGPEARAIS